ncbi:MAG: hypothetical protein R3C29_17790 [Dehalococcoidia bacterium]
MRKLSPEEDPRVLTRGSRSWSGELRTANDLIEVLKPIPIVLGPAGAGGEVSAAEEEGRDEAGASRETPSLAGGKRQSARGRRRAAAGGADSSGAEA